MIGELTISIKPLLPVITLVVTAVTILFVDVFGTRDNESHYGYLGLVGLALAAWFTLGLWDKSSLTFASTFITDKLSVLTSLTYFLIAGLTFLFSPGYLHHEGRNLGEYYALVLFAVVGLIFMTSAQHLILFFIGLEVLSIALYALAGFVRQRDLCNEAALKYLFLGGFSSAILLMGLAVIYGVTNSLYLHQVARYVAAHGASATFILGMSLVMVGFFFKISAAPFHAWAPDVYGGAPAPVAGFMATAAKVAVFAVILRFLDSAVFSVKSHWIAMVVVVSVLSMVIGNFAALRQENIKRMLAYSSIAHAGYALVGVAAASRQGGAAVVFYMLAYSLMNLGAFGVVALVGRQNESYVNISDYAGLAAKRPVLAAAMAICLFSLAGIPGTAGFMGKFYVFAAGVKAGQIPLVVIAVLNSAVAAYYYLRVVYMMYMEEPREEYQISFHPAAVVALLVIVVGIFQLGIIPGSLLSASYSSFALFTF
ncbi:MAG TPA: NADH-quinone oxidoreductase subunit N [Thermosulfidibacter takaii]|uniref:NADH-quinone oxidoreductase subunit N n=1 Tax=Thermosulfidibacter takaii TaxID=412593 RepID=A0A7C0U600_9BACT|nr:NADH-quinone oxidoreductase subunit N [Thermosulfidibacter takaii]